MIILVASLGQQTCLNSPRRKLIGGSHVLHDILQGLLVLDIHLVADLPLPRPVVHHGGRDSRGGGRGAEREKAVLRSHAARSWCGASKVVVVVAVRRRGKWASKEGEAEAHKMQFGHVTS